MSNAPGTRLDWLNYHHLLYFWLVAREGGLAPAAAKLRLAHQTVSAQVHALEDALGEKLFERQGRRLALTELGRVAFRYADEIFALGTELQETLRGRPSGRPLRLEVGVADAVPKLIARSLLAPAQRIAEPVRLVCREDKPERLLAALALHELDVVLSDAPVPPSANVRAYSHLLGECAVAVFAPPPVARRLARGFPGSLAGAPMILPTENSALRRALEHWFDAQQIRPLIVAEFEDSALLKAFAQDGDAAFVAHEPIAAEVERQYRVRRIATLPGLVERFYALTVERRLRHPGVLAISATAREHVFPPPGRARRRAGRTPRPRARTRSGP
jgi:LysR family transcriptional activator of nhaA